MSKINVEHAIQNLDLGKIEMEYKNGKDIKTILSEIDIKPVIKAEMIKSNPSVTEKDVDDVVKGIDLVKVVSALLNKDNSSAEHAGNSFEDLSVDEMMMLQGAGDVEAETLPVLTLSSAGCVAGISAVGSAVLSAIRC